MSYKFMHLIILFCNRSQERSNVPIFPEKTMGLLVYTHRACVAIYNKSYFAHSIASAFLFFSMHEIRSFVYPFQSGRDIGDIFLRGPWKPLRSNIIAQIDST